jgi:hypothetical protein
MLIPGMMRNTELCQNAYTWFEGHFEDVGDYEPTVDQIHLDLCEKVDIYETYKKEMIIRHGDPDGGFLEISSWLQIWNESFPFVKIRQYKQVSGKCWTCYYINNGRDQARTKTELKAFKELHQMHKMGSYMLERRQYKNRREYATQPENSHRICSIIIDGMDQNHSLLPRFGTDVSTTDEFIVTLLAF